MLVLALDTTTRKGSCAVVKDGHTLREDISDPDRDHAARLPADLMILLARTDLRLRDIDAYAVAIGPGSFTGLRVGIAAMQGLAMAGGRPLIGISTLDALAAGQGRGQVVTWVDAWRGEVYSALYQDGRAICDPVVTHPEAVLAGIDRLTTFVGDGAETYRELISRTLGGLAVVPGQASPALAASIARLAAEAVSRGAGAAPDAIKAIYVRRPDVELTREARSER